jgi:hypothetical protein
MEDPLNVSIPMAGVDTTMPLVSDGDYECQITASAVEPNKARTGHNWNLTLKTVDPVTATDGREMSSATFFVNNIALQPTDTSTDPEGFKRNIAAAMDAIFGTVKATRPIFNRAVVEGSLGRRVVANVYISEYPEGSGVRSNKVRRIRKVTT